MIPLSVPNLAGNEWKYIKDCLDTNWVSSVGSYVDKFEESIKTFTGAKHAISTVNGTAALHISLILAGVKAGDFVIVPNITFIASANSITYLSADPIFIDIDKDTWQMDLSLLENFLRNHTFQKNNQCIHKETNRTIPAIMPVHVLGNMCNMEKLNELATEFNICIIEDATEALGSYYKNKHAGRFGKFGCFSFNGNKIITTGGGGMIVTDEEELAKKAKHITTQAKSDSFEYIHDETGYNYRLVNILAAMGLAQMELLPDFIKRKKEITEQYISSLSKIDGIQFQKINENVVPNNWLFTIYSNKQKELIKQLTTNNVQVRPLWLPMNQLKMFNEKTYITNKNNSNEVYQHSLSLPCSTSISNNEIETVINILKEVYL